jgi:shikimate kinase
MQRDKSETVASRPIYLIGYMAAGKTTVGKRLAERIGWHFVDLDDAFLQIHGYTPNEYIRQFGIDAFRRKEKYVLEDIADMSPYENVVYATGGGYPCYEDNMECLAELGTSIYLRWEARDLAKRLMLTDLSERPVLQGRTEEELLSFISPQLAAREEYYLKADHVVDAPGFTEDADEQLVDAILAMFKDLKI